MGTRIKNLKKQTNKKIAEVMRNCYEPVYIFVTDGLTSIYQGEDGIVQWVEDHTGKKFDFADQALNYALKEGVITEAYRL